MPPVAFKPPRVAAQTAGRNVSTVESPVYLPTTGSCEVLIWFER